MNRRIQEHEARWKNDDDRRIREDEEKLKDDEARKKDYDATKADAKWEADEAAWKETEVATNFFMLFPMDSSFAKVHTEVRMTYDNNNLYLLDVCV